MFGILVLDYIEFARLPIREYERPMKEKAVALKVITGYGYDNEQLKVQSITGNLYSLMISRESCQHGSIRHKELQKQFGERMDIHKTYNLNLWNITGGIALYGTTFIVKEYSDPIPHEVVKEVYRAMDEYEDGIVTCSDCGDKVKRDEAGEWRVRQYFAGIYCKECWEGATGKHAGKGGWKEVESRETYN